MHRTAALRNGPQTAIAGQYRLTEGLRLSWGSKQDWAYLLPELAVLTVLGSGGRHLRCNLLPAGPQH